MNNSDLENPILAHVASVESAAEADVEAIRSDTRDATILIVPGLGNSGPSHWQTKWLDGRFPNATRVEQDDWDHAEKDVWVRKLHEYIVSCSRKEIILVGHSLACSTIAHHENAYPATECPKIRGALLVAPTDISVPQEGVIDFSPMELKPLGFPSIVVASEDDPIGRFETAKMYAERWGSQFRNVGRKGHINAASGIGDWLEGLKFLRELLEMRK
jgi:hypothetical protein